MAFFDWDTGLETGLGVIDDQHRKLVGFVNELHEAMRNRTGREAVGAVLDELAKYAVYHFSTEEKAFERYGYERKDAHIKIHADFVARVVDMQAAYKRGDLTVTVDTLSFLIDWVKKHIMVEDMLYVPSLTGKAID